MVTKDELFHSDRCQILHFNSYNLGTCQIKSGSSHFFLTDVKFFLLTSITPVLVSRSQKFLHHSPYHIKHFSLRPKKLTTRNSHVFSPTPLWPLWTGQIATFHHFHSFVPTYFPNELFMNHTEFITSPNRPSITYRGYWLWIVHKFVCKYFFYVNPSGFDRSHVCHKSLSSYFGPRPKCVT